MLDMSQATAMSKKSCERWHEPHDNDSDAQHTELPEHYVAGVEAGW
jgi:hypothetical protein